MTLDTRMRIHEQCDARELFDFCRLLLGPSDGGKAPLDSNFTDEPNRLCNRLGQGYSAILEVEFDLATAPKSEWEKCYCEEDQEDAIEPDPDYKCSQCRKPDAYLEISWDTAYGYKGPNGEQCGDLHAAYIVSVAKWCDERGLTYSWHNEFNGDWCPGLENLNSLSKGGVEATAWFTSIALPAILSDISAKSALN